MTSSKFKNNGSFATSAMVSALVIGMHVAGVHLLVADQAAMYDNTMASIAVSAQQTNVVKSVVRTDAFVVTASRLKA
ncbi:MAG: hypothetical protein ACK45Y_13275 [Betaproteobacteria bacterium]|jgi:hypothetical protein|nr:hypothetical protein AEM42_14110 [Betaproteobacteria bacterium UKL13-2]HCG53224.1 hypothetical protein [Betaproteobacteria bacterium]